MSEPYDVPSDELSLFNSGRATVRRNIGPELDAEGEDLLTTVASERRSIDRRLQNIEDTLARLSKEGEETRTLIHSLLLRLPAFGSKAGTSEREQDGFAEAGLVSTYFRHEFIQRVLSFNLQHSVYKRHCNAGVEEKKSVPVLFLAAMLYAEGHSEETKQESATFVAKVSGIRNKNRISILRNLIFNVRKRAERELHVDCFSNSSASGQKKLRLQEPEQSQESSTHPASALDQIPWMNPGFFKKSHFEVSAGDDAASNLTPVSGRKKRRASLDLETSQEELALTVVKQVRILLNEFTTRGRHLARKEFAAGLGYALVPVQKEGRPVPVTLEPHPDYDYDLRKRLVPEEDDWSLVEDCCTGPASDTEKGHRANDEIFARLRTVGRDSGMLWIAEYEVVVESPGGGKEQRTLRRSIDLVQVALNFCIAYCQSRDRFHFLRSSVHSLRMVYCIALAFRSLADRKFHSESQEVPGGVAECALLSYMTLRADVFNRIMENAVLSMRSEMFEELNIPASRNSAAGDSAGADSDNDMHGLVEDEEEGVVFIPDF